jgi:DsbC/DsbD-like thiol-disulfide interchange protein
MHFASLYRVAGLAALSLAVPVATPVAQPPLLAPGARHVRAELVADVAAVAPGTPFRMAVRLSMEKGWHVNWINPGDAGLAPSIAWKLPAGFKAGILHWPLPARFETGPLTIFGYADEVLLMTDVQPAAGLAPGGNIEVAADVSWLACAEECIPGSASLTLQLPVEKTARSNDEQRKAFDATEARLPQHAVAWNVDAHIEQSTTLVLEIQKGTESSAPLEGLFFFPYDPGLIENAEAQVVSMQPGPGGQSLYLLRITRARIPSGAMTKVQGLLVATSGLSAGGGPAAIEIDISVRPH